jgi:hypothetical protein
VHKMSVPAVSLMLPSSSRHHAMVGESS